MRPPITEEEDSLICTDKPSSKCSCYDDECIEVISPIDCWIGNEFLGGPADGYCPLMLGMNLRS